MTTGDLSVRPGNGRSRSELVDFVLSALLADRPHAQLIEELQIGFGLSDEDAELSLDRICGGIVRALTLNPANKPPRSDDPLAARAFTIVWNTFPGAGWLFHRKQRGGPWAAWDERRRKK